MKVSGASCFEKFWSYSLRSQIWDVSGFTNNPAIAFGRPSWLFYKNAPWFTSNQSVVSVLVAPPRENVLFLQKAPTLFSIQPAILYVEHRQRSSTTFGSGQHGCSSSWRQRGGSMQYGGDGWSLQGPDPYAASAREANPKEGGEAGSPVTTKKIGARL